MATAKVPQAWWRRRGAQSARDMSVRSFHSLVVTSAHRPALPLAMYPALTLTGAKVSDIATNPRAQFDAQAALHERYGLSFVMSAMDLSVEAEAFGCSVAMSETELPMITGRRVASPEEARNLSVPEPGDRRTSVYLEAVRLLRDLPGAPFVLAGCIGPFSLAARLAGVSEALELTITEPEVMHTLLEKCTLFLTAYLAAFEAAGARGVIMAEPAAGLLSPRALAAFSSRYISHIAASFHDGSLEIILHNCAARLLHLPAVLETGLKAFHFGAPMDMIAALDRVAPDVVRCGNLDPTAVFLRGSPADVTVRTKHLLSAAATHRNFVISSGCDLPPHVPLANLDAFYQTVFQEFPSPSEPDCAPATLSQNLSQNHFG
jgi:uroporphyrinogen decarboxylase